MLLHDDAHRRFIASLTTSRLIDATPHCLVRTLQHQSLFSPPPAAPQRLPPVAIDLDPTPNGHGAVTLHCLHSGISERRPLQTRHTSPGRLTAETSDDTSTNDASRMPTLALTIDLTPLVRPGPTLATRATLSFHFVREPWWPRDLTHALASLADLWLQRLKEQARAPASGRARA